MSICRKALIVVVSLLIIAACETNDVPSKPSTASAPSVQAVLSAGKAATPSTPVTVDSKATEGDAPDQTPLEPSPHDAPRGSTCGLRSTLRSLGLRDGVEQYSLTLTNTSKRAVQLVVPGDGSEVGWRTPILTWSAKQEGKPVAELAPARCGLMNAIEAGEIFTLAPGQSRTLVEWLGSPRYAPGTYDVELRYRNDPSLSATKAPAAPEVAAKLTSSSACDVTSNALRVTFK